MSPFTPTPNMKAAARWLVLACAMVAFGGGGEAIAQAKSPYEYEPYRVVVWVAVEPTPKLAATLAESLATQISAEVGPAFGAAWNAEAFACPAALRRRAAVELHAVSVADVREADAGVLDADKLFLVGCRFDEAMAGIVVAARELDCRSRTFGEAVTRDALQAENLNGAVLSALVQAFAPVVRIERVEGNKIVTRLRAGGLLLGDDSPAAVKPGDVLQPVVRRNDRQGEPRAGGIQRLPYTFLEIDRRAGFRVECTMHSGVRSALGVRGGRIERTALLVRPQARGTRIVLRSRASDARPLIGYEVLTRPPGQKSEPTLLELTDLNGVVQLPLAGRPVQFVYVRHGGQMLARVPVVPGLVAEQPIALNDDDLRLLAESYYVAMQNQVMDLVAQREVLAARIRLRIERNEFEDAQKMLAELRNFTTRAELLRQVERERSDYASDDAGVQGKVDKMFAELRKLLAKHLDPRLVDQLSNELSAAKKT